MLFGCCENKDGMCWRFLQRFKERVEGGLRQHVHFVNDVNLVLPDLRWYAHLVYEAAYVIYAVV
ncbi:hypothetical protein SDC9_186481 [bioreactor metagenome]|uniref:Uncharacterized protein n=1 Tax=bioreactor metagenome TaxID=1076179 RepID=A0A645HK28_9ZZZZ